MGTQSKTILDRTHSRYPASARDEAYTRSYRAIRLAVGFLGIALPLIFIFVEAYLLKGGVHVRGSLSAYYHSPLQDVFVGGLCVIGVLLATYMAGEKNTLDSGRASSGASRCSGSSSSPPCDRACQKARPCAAAFRSRLPAPSWSSNSVNTQRR